VIPFSSPDAAQERASAGTAKSSSPV